MSSSPSNNGMDNAAFECEVIADKSHDTTDAAINIGKNGYNVDSKPKKQQIQEQAADSTEPNPDAPPGENVRQITEDDFEDMEFESSWFRDGVEKGLGAFKTGIAAGNKFMATYNLSFGKIFNILFFVLYNAYFIACIVHFVKSENDDIQWCDGVGLLIIMTSIVYLYQFCSRVVSPLLDKLTSSEPYLNLKDKAEDLWAKPMVHYGAGAVFAVALAIFLIIDTADNRKRLVSVFGIITILFTGFVFSVHPGKVRWRQVLLGLALQIIFGLMVLKWDVGRAIVKCAGDKVTGFLEYTDSGSTFMYGWLVDKQMFNLRALNETSIAYEVAKDINDSKAMNFILFFKTLSNIYFFCFVVYMLFYMGAMQWIVAKIGKLLQMTIGTTACESTVSAANIFLSSGESSILIKPYLKLMTKSELHSVFTSGLSTVAGSILAVYIGFGVSASHLLSASVMSSPAALACAKLMYPETKKSKTNADNIKAEERTESNILDAASRGATAAVFLVLSITANLIAILAFIAFINAIIGFFGGLLGYPELSFDRIMAKCFIPVAWLMGVPNKDLELIGDILSQNYFVNTITAYIRLGKITPIIDHRSKVIATYALCGFTHPASIGSQLAALSALEPSRKGDLARVAVRAFCSAVLACCMTACVAGAIID